MRAELTGNTSLTRISRRRVDGLLLLDKPVGITSNGALSRVKRLYGAQKAGHTGTLDPLASGLLPICFGETTKFARFLIEAPKRYLATVRFGVTTATQDGEGEAIRVRPVTFGRDAIATVLPRFIGRQWQLPPAHSALKFRGRPYYDYAREGIDIPRVPREVTVHDVRLLAWSSPDATLDVECGKGTYIRALAADLGDALGCGAHLAGLRRTRTGGFRIDEAIEMALLEAMDPQSRSARLLPIDAPLGGVERLDIDGADADALLQGRRIVAALRAGHYRLYGPEGIFLGIAEATPTELRPVRLVRADVRGTEHAE